MAASPNPALVTWPAQFGSPKRNFSFSIDDGVIRTKMDRGSKARSQFVDPLLKGNFRVRMGNGVLQYFQAWHQHKLSNGSVWFNFQIQSGDEMTWEECRFTAPYKIDPDEGVKGGSTTISFEIEIRTHSIPSEGALDAFLE